MITQPFWAGWPLPIFNIIFKGVFMVEDVKSPMGQAKPEGETNRIPKNAKTQSEQASILGELRKFTTPSTNDIENMGDIKKAAEHFGAMVVNTCPENKASRDAMRLIREALLSANISIVYGGIID
jgi:hypothetical protein